MKSRIIAERYASALLNVAKNRGEMENVLGEMTFLKKLVAENPGLKRFLESPHITQEDKNSLVRKILSPILTKTSVNFLLLLVRKYRLLYLTEIIEEYQKVYDAEMSIQRADVTTVFPLDDTLIEKLSNTVERILKKHVILCFYIDPKIIGGLIIRTPSLIIDGSIRRKLLDMRYTLSSLKVS